MIGRAAPFSVQHLNQRWTKEQFNFVAGVQTTGNGVEGCCEVETSAILTLAMKKSVFLEYYRLRGTHDQKRLKIGWIWFAIEL